MNLCKTQRAPHLSSIRCVYRPGRSFSQKRRCAPEIARTSDVHVLLAHIRLRSECFVIEVFLEAVYLHAFVRSMSRRKAHPTVVFLQSVISAFHNARRCCPEYSAFLLIFFMSLLHSVQYLKQHLTKSLRRFFSFGVCFYDATRNSLRTVNLQGERPLIFAETDICIQAVNE